MIRSDDDKFNGEKFPLFIIIFYTYFSSYILFYYRGGAVAEDFPRFHNHLMISLLF